jgi:TonB family protein
MTAPPTFRFIRHALFVYSSGLVAFFLATAVSAPNVPGAETSSHEAIERLARANPPSARISADRTGVLQTRDGLTLHLAADLGSVRVLSLDPGAAPVVRYTVHLETDARASLAQQLLDHYSLSAKATPSGVEINGSLPPQASHHASNAQFWVQFEVAVPPGYSVEVHTLAGDIETQDIGGTAALLTQGGNIRAGKIGFVGMRGVLAGRSVAKLETQGGHIQVLDVAGDLNAFTAGGHITAGNIAGDAVLRSGGGHIRAGQIAGRAELDTDGGNITVGKAGSVVNVRTGGGQIDFGEVRGSVRAQTGGGGIRVMYVSGPMEVESSAGSICLTRVAGAVRAATAGGSITAWINPDSPTDNGTVHLAGASQLSSGDGDIVVFLPRNLAANIEASVESGGARHIEADPALRLTLDTPANRNGGPLHAATVLNGGGPLLKLRTTAGNIHLQFLDSQVALRDSLIREQKERLTQRLSESAQFAPVANKEFIPVEGAAPEPEQKGDWLESWMDKLEIAFFGGLREDPGEFQKRLVYSPRPAYPELARRTGIDGIVRLQVLVTRDGRVELQKILEGAPVLVDAASEAVKRWRAKPVWVDGKEIDVISTVTFNFQLH